MKYQMRRTCDAWLVQASPDGERWHVVDYVATKAEAKDLIRQLKEAQGE